MRINLGSLATVCMILAFIADLVVYFFVDKDLDVYGDNDNYDQKDNKLSTDSGVDLRDGVSNDGMVEIELNDKQKSSDKEVHVWRNLWFKMQQLYKV